jgi:hypothetical protein
LTQQSRTKLDNELYPSSYQAADEAKRKALSRMTTKNSQNCRVARSRKIKKVKFGHKQFQKRRNSKMGKKAKFSKKISLNI